MINIQRHRFLVLSMLTARAARLSDLQLRLFHGVGTAVRPCPKAIRGALPGWGGAGEGERFVFDAGVLRLVKNQAATLPRSTPYTGVCVCEK